jgi:zinc/manganese transport system substrate-binding protein
VMQEEHLLSGGTVKLFCYNEQAIEPITRTLLSMATAHGVPVVAVYETRPATKSYQQWMLAEARAVWSALSARVSTKQIR